MSSFTGCTLYLLELLYRAYTFYTGVAQSGSPDFALNGPNGAKSAVTVLPLRTWKDVLGILGTD